MNKVKALLKVLAKRSNVVLIITAIAVILGAFGIEFGEDSQVQVAELVTALVSVIGIALGISISEKEVKNEVDKARAEKEQE
ncbi:hypothetical protein HNO53_12940 [Billgrantia antri]|uniref:Holin n=1 Tax=Halomonas sulfidivorans TaxID=2733488 RepID=A0ABX7WJ70_9GAMM|nr:hypothetical protein [Halomonas sulfidivorans]QTP59542.1 hypothetical protein HNO53_12940 [Halomonas sulfidivorans]